MVPNDVQIETYMRGECHVHAIACVRLHGGSFAVAYNDAEAYDDDGEVSSVIHVWSVHEGPDGLIARDVTGDMPFVPDLLKGSLSEFFPDTAADFMNGEAWIDMRATEEEVRALSGNEDHQPLFEITEKDIAEASLLGSVTEAPGSRAIPQHMQEFSTPAP